MWKLLIKYRFVILFVVPLGFSAMVTTTSCNLWRPGTTVKPVGGGGGGGRYHTSPASAKGRKKRKY
ncbi:MAG: hypothetical protein P1U41_00770 [Vicingaceae bacterium]|nr:hypothetical protein [Vicingaceae bacterium]